MKHRKSCSISGQCSELMNVLQWLGRLFDSDRTETHYSHSQQWIKHVLIHEAAVLGTAPPDYWGSGKKEAEKFWSAWAAEEERYSGRL